MDRCSLTEPATCTSKLMCYVTEVRCRAHKIPIFLSVLSHQSLAEGEVDFNNDSNNHDLYSILTFKAAVWPPKYV